MAILFGLATRGVDASLPITGAIWLRNIWTDVCPSVRLLWSPVFVGLDVRLGLVEDPSALGIGDIGPVFG
jgi:hypothetical protein